MKKLMCICLMFVLFLASAMPVSAIRYQTDYSYLPNKNKDTFKDLKNGSISVSVKKRSKRYAYVVLEKGNKMRAYQIPSGKVVKVPLMYGKGTYRIIVGYSKSRGDSPTLMVVKDTKIKLNISKPTVRSFIILGDQSPEIQKLLRTEFKGWKKWTPRERVIKVNKYLRYNYYYSDKLASYTDTHWYTPDYKARIKDRGLICYDVAAITASLLRSMKVPTRFIGGYWKDNMDTYHAWNQVYFSGKWRTVDNTFDLQLKIGKHLERMDSEPVFDNGKEYIIYESM